MKGSRYSKKKKKDFGKISNIMDYMESDQPIAQVIEEDEPVEMNSAADQVKAKHAAEPIKAKHAAEPVKAKRIAEPKHAKKSSAQASLSKASPDTASPERILPEQAPPEPELSAQIKPMQRSAGAAGTPQEISEKGAPDGKSSNFAEKTQPKKKGLFTRLSQPASANPAGAPRTMSESSLQRDREKKQKAQEKERLKAERIKKKQAEKAEKQAAKAENQEARQQKGKQEKENPAADTTLSQVKPAAAVSTLPVPSDGGESVRDRMDPTLLAKAMYRISIVLLLLMISLSLWLGRDSYTLSGLQTWFELEFTGSNIGDGFPLIIKGHDVTEQNFTHVGTHAAALSNTAMTSYNKSGKELYTLRHSFEHPGMKRMGEQFVIYDIGGTGYIAGEGGRQKAEGVLPQEVFTGAVSGSGVYALAHAKDGYASGITVFAENGTEKYTYSFSNQYVTALAINSDGSKGVVCGIGTEGGIMQSWITILDFNQSNILYEHRIVDNMLLDVYWGENDVIYALGDEGFFWSSDGKELNSYDFEGKWLTPYQMENSCAFISVSSYEHAGDSTVLCFDGSADPLAIPLPDHADSISSFGGAIGILYNGRVGFFDRDTGLLLGEVPGNDDIKSIALASERSAYTLAISEIRYVVLRND